MAAEYERSQRKVPSFSSRRSRARRAELFPSETLPKNAADGIVAVVSPNRLVGIAGYNLSRSLTLVRTRRAFLYTVISAGTAGALGFGFSRCRRVPQPRGNQEVLQGFFTAAESLIVSAACERILPRDDQDPGAVDLGVPSYVDRALAAGDFAGRADAFRRGLQGLNRKAMGLMHKPFHEVDDDDRDIILRDYESGSAEERTFFQMLFDLTLEGAFGDPSHGGNKDGLGWRLIGFAPGEPMPGMPGMHH